MKSVKLGTENLKVIFSRGIKIGVEVQQAAADGIELEDTLVVLKNLSGINEIAAKGPAAWAEFKDLDTTEADEVVEHIAIEFDIPNDEVEARIESGLRWVSRGYRLTLDVKDWVLDGRDLFAPKNAA